MSANAKRILLWSLLGLILGATLVWAFIPKPIPVDMLTLEPGEMTVTVDEEGETRVRDVFVLSAPISGRALRIDAEVGDEVLAQQTKVAEIEPTDAALLDPRSEAQAHADIRAAEANLVLAEASVKRQVPPLLMARLAPPTRLTTGRVHSSVPPGVRIRAASFRAALKSSTMCRVWVRMKQSKLPSAMPSARVRSATMVARGLDPSMSRTSLRSSTSSPPKSSV